MNTLSVLVLVVLSACIAQAQSTPETFNVVFTTTQGDINLFVNRSWAPHGVDHFYTLLQANYYNENAFFRVIESPQPFVAQWGISGTPATSTKWNMTIPDDPISQSNLAGTVTYAAEMNSNNMACCRTTQLFINYVDNGFLDSEGFVPIGIITSGLENAKKFYSKYGENPDQDLIYTEGNAYLKKKFPKLDYLVSTKIVSETW
eukprot:gene12634-14840_t